MTSDVVVVGSVNVDLLLTVDRHPTPGETLLGGSGAQSAGGKGANQALAAARRGASTGLVGAVGDDAGAAVALARLTAAGVDLGGVATVPGPTGLAVVTLARDGENTIVVVPGANAAVSPAVVEAAAGTITAARVCVLQAEIPLASATAAARIAAAAGVRVVLNVAPAAALPLATLRLADPLVVNEHEAALVLGWAREAEGLSAGEPPSSPSSSSPSPTEGGEVTPEAGLDLARGLRELGIPGVVVTLGGAGAVGISSDGEWTVPGLRVAVVDTTGAGDAFVGALAASLARGAGLHEAARDATRVAAHAVQRLGAQDSYPEKDEPLP
ncbi:ribokinase [Serinibacter arcticus]|uniref:Ribokinase n=1 Tax=Serinibacter arcticus TaxID=1655435 RepID=A0A2U1ZUI8_9MICO|nr:ribokinase [Serinibacter arcticus]PWD50644.1 ribokinase [Serinibacter arcticus]